MPGKRCLYLQGMHKLNEIKHKALNVNLNIREGCTSSCART